MKVKFFLFSSLLGLLSCNSISPDSNQKPISKQVNTDTCDWHHIILNTSFEYTYNTLFAPKKIIKPTLKDTSLEIITPEQIHLNFKIKSYRINNNIYSFGYKNSNGMIIILIIMNGKNYLISTNKIARCDFLGYDKYEENVFRIDTGDCSLYFSLSTNSYGQTITEFTTIE